MKQPLVGNCKVVKWALKFGWLEGVSLTRFGPGPAHSLIRHMPHRNCPGVEEHRATSCHQPWDPREAYPLSAAYLTNNWARGDFLNIHWKARTGAGRSKVLLSSLAQLHFPGPTVC